MNIRSWRIVKSNRSKQLETINGVEIPAAFNGGGASLYPGRWNSKGTPLVYTAESQSLATLEILVHLEDSFLLESFAIFPVEFSDKDLIILDELPDNWRENPPNQKTRIIGDQWAKKNQSLVLGVPSSVIPNEMNYLINPYHPKVKHLKIGRPESFPFDARLS